MKECMCVITYNLLTQKHISLAFSHTSHLLNRFGNVFHIKGLWFLKQLANCMAAQVGPQRYTNEAKMCS